MGLVEFEGMNMEKPCIACGEKRNVGALTLSFGKMICFDCAIEWCRKYNEATDVWISGFYQVTTFPGTAGRWQDEGQPVRYGKLVITGKCKRHDKES